MPGDRHGIEAHLELEESAVAPGATVVYTIVNTGPKSVGYGATSVGLERRSPAGWVLVPAPA
jgi:hypothetical protein